MNLEDHAGDVVRKSRLMMNVPASDVARAAGISESDLSAFEDSGSAPAQLNYASLASLIDVHASKLERFAKGWSPARIELSRWRELRMFTTSGEGMTVNYYLIWDEATRDAALFDTGWEVSEALKVIFENNLQLRHLFITHSHRDHIAAVSAVREAFPKARIHSSSKNAPLEQRNKPNEIVHVGGLRVTHRDTPGHAEDGVTYLVGNWPEDAPHVAIVGDAIFAGSIGGAPQLGAFTKQKIREQILSLPGDTLICPGHGPVTTVAEQAEVNPFFA